MEGEELVDVISDVNAPEEPDISLRERVDRLENESKEMLRQTERRIVLAELKIEATHAGMIDMDGLKFLDLTDVHLDDDDGVVDGRELIAKLKRAKPWLFTAHSSSSVAKVPPSRPARQKLATEMTEDEYRIARANVIKRTVI